MIVYVFVSTLAVLFAFLESKYNSKNGLKFAMLIIALFLGLRYNFGNDYRSYYTYYLHLDLNGFSSKGEIGWDYINKTFSIIGPEGFYMMVFMISIVTCIVLYFFIKKYVPKQYYWLAVFYYAFNSSLLLILSSAMRQQLAGILFIVALHFLFKKKWYYYIVLIFLASTIHKSAEILYPLVVFGIPKINKVKKQMVFVPVFMFLFFMFVDKSFFLSFIDQFTTDNANFYTRYLEERNISFFTFSLGNILKLATLIIITLEIRSLRMKEIYFFIFVFFLIISIDYISSYLMMIRRLNLYFLPLMMAFYSNIIFSSKKTSIKIFLITAIMVVNLYELLLFFSNPTFRDAFSEYHTFLFEL